MSSIDESKKFVPLNIAVLTISDTRSLEDDKSGTTLSERITAAGHHLAAREPEGSLALRRGVIERSCASNRSEKTRRLRFAHGSVVLPRSAWRLAHT